MAHPENYFIMQIFETTLETDFTYPDAIVQRSFLQGRCSQTSIGWSTKHSKKHGVSQLRLPGPPGLKTYSREEQKAYMVRCDIAKQINDEDKDDGSLAA